MNPCSGSFCVSCPWGRMFRRNVSRPIPPADWLLLGETVTGASWGSGVFGSCSAAFRGAGPPLGLVSLVAAGLIIGAGFGAQEEGLPRSVWIEAGALRRGLCSLPGSALPASWNALPSVGHHIQKLVLHSHEFFQILPGRQGPGEYIGHRSTTLAIKLCST